MKKRLRIMWGILKKIGNANINLDHYWFLPKPVMIPLENEDLDIRDDNRLKRNEMHKGSWPHFVTNYKLRQNKK